MIRINKNFKKYIFQVKINNNLRQKIKMNFLNSLWNWVLIIICILNKKKYQFDQNMIKIKK